MRRITYFFSAWITIGWIGIGAGLFLIACSSPNQNTTAGGPSDSTDLSQTPTETRLSADGTPMANQPGSGAVKSSGPAVPEGANFTLLCFIFTSPTHVLDADQAEQNLKRDTHSNDWYVIHKEDESDLFFGYYKTIDDRSQLAEYTRAQSDKARLSAMVDRNGEKLFAEVIFQPVASADPPAPKEWDVFNNPGFWTLQIAKYMDNPQRKTAAVEAVRNLRAKNVVAFYHHFESVSEVYVGSWPRSAIKEQDANEAMARDPNQSILVLPGPIQGHENDQILDKNGRPMKVIYPKLDIVDPSMKAMIARFPYTYINGETLGDKKLQADGSTKVVPYPSYLVQVPQKENDMDMPAPPDKGGEAGPMSPPENNIAPPPNTPGIP